MQLALELGYDVKRLKLHHPAQAYMSHPCWQQLASPTSFALACKRLAGGLAAEFSLVPQPPRSDAQCGLEPAHAAPAAQLASAGPPMPTSGAVCVEEEAGSMGQAADVEAAAPAAAAEGKTTRQRGWGNAAAAAAGKRRRVSTPQPPITTPPATPLGNGADVREEGAMWEGICKLVEQAEEQGEWRRES